MLTEDARRPYREITDAVDRSPPTVSEQVERLQELGIIERFTVDLDRSMVVEKSKALVEFDVGPTHDERVAETVESVPAVEHVVRTVDGSVLCPVHTDQEEVRDLLMDVLDGEDVREYSVRSVTDAVWTPAVGEISLEIECVVCGKSVDSGGVSVELGDRTYEVRCPSCVSEIEDQYDELERAAESD